MILYPTVLHRSTNLSRKKKKKTIAVSVADPGCLSRIRLFSIPDPNCVHPGSRILIKKFKYFNPQKSKKMVSKL